MSTDEFDDVAGTSTGAIIATCIALGMSVAQIRNFYLESGRQMFNRACLLRRFRNNYEDERIAEKLKDEMAEETTLGSDKLRTLLLIVMRNATTDSPWPLSNNPCREVQPRDTPSSTGKSATSSGRRAQRAQTIHLPALQPRTHSRLAARQQPGSIAPRHVQPLDSTRHMDELQAVGCAVACEAAHHGRRKEAAVAVCCTMWSEPKSQMEQDEILDA